jgi:hypothetical protein
LKRRESRTERAPCIIQGVLIRESQARLDELLRRSGLSSEAVRASDIGTLVDTFQRFCAEAVTDVAPPDEDGDGVLAQFGTRTFDSAQLFVVDLTRQFIEPREDAEIWQLSCALLWQPTPRTNTVGSGDLWSFGWPLDQFFETARTLPGFAWALATERDPERLAISLEHV